MWPDNLYIATELQFSLINMAYCPLSNWSDVSLSAFAADSLVVVASLRILLFGFASAAQLSKKLELPAYLRDARQNKNVWVGSFS